MSLSTRAWPRATLLALSCSVFSSIFLSACGGGTNATTTTTTLSYMAAGNYNVLSASDDGSTLTLADGTQLAYTTDSSGNPTITSPPSYTVYADRGAATVQLCNASSSAYNVFWTYNGASAQQITDLTALYGLTFKLVVNCSQTSSVTLTFINDGTATFSDGVHTQTLTSTNVANLFSTTGTTLGTGTSITPRLAQMRIYGLTSSSGTAYFLSEVSTAYIAGWTQ